MRILVLGAGPAIGLAVALMGAADRLAHGVEVRTNDRRYDNTGLIHDSGLSGLINTVRCSLAVTDELLEGEPIAERESLAYSLLKATLHGLPHFNDLFRTVKDSVWAGSFP